MGLPSDRPPGQDGPADPCPFCAIGAGTVDADLVALRTPAVFVVPAAVQRERNRGHALILPVRHATGLREAEPALLAEILAVAGRVTAAQREAFGATGATLFLNEDAPGQALRHLHLHSVPRRAGDGFRMPEPDRAEVPREERRAQADALRRALEGRPAS